MGSPDENGRDGAGWDEASSYGAGLAVVVGEGMGRQAPPMHPSENTVNSQACPLRSAMFDILTPV